MPGACAVYDAIDGELLGRIVLSVATRCSVIRVCSSVPCWRVPVFEPLHPVRVRRMLYTALSFRFLPPTRLVGDDAVRFCGPAAVEA